MPIFECQKCDFITEHSQKAKMHHALDPNHYFKRFGENTNLDKTIQKKNDEIYGWTLLTTDWMKFDPMEEADIKELLAALKGAFFLLLFLFSFIIILVGVYNGK